MFSIDRIFVPLDLSSSSRAALELARQLGQPHPQLHIAHIIDAWKPYQRQVFFPYAALGEDDVEFEHELRETARELLIERYELDPSWLGAELAITMGHIRQELPELLRRSDADMVIMGAFGEGGVSPESLGSTAATMIRHAIQPTLLVREHNQTKLSNIVCALDLSPQSGEVLKAALGLAVMAEANLEIIYVLPDPLSQDTNNVLRSQLKFNRKQVLERSKDKLDALFERALQSIEIPYPHRPVVEQLWQRRRVLAGDPAKEIITHADAINADVIVVGSRNIQNSPSHLLGQVCWSVTRRAPCHVLVVPLEQQAQLLEEPS